MSHPLACIPGKSTGSYLCRSAAFNNWSIKGTLIAGIFILSADRIPLLRSHVILGSLLYGVGVFIVMWFIVLLLSAAPLLPVPPIPQVIEGYMEHILLIGLPLGLLVQWNNSTDR